MDFLNVVSLGVEVVHTAQTQKLICQLSTTKLGKFTTQHLVPQQIASIQFHALNAM